jgi:hypothetical protein
MAAKAMVPVEAIPCIDRFRGHGPLLQKRRLDDVPPAVTPMLSMAASYNTVAPIAYGECATNCRSGPWPRKRM